MNLVSGTERTETMTQQVFEIIIYFHFLTATSSSLIATFILWMLKDWWLLVTIAIINSIINILFAIYIRICMDLVFKLKPYILYEIISSLIILLYTFLFLFLFLKTSSESADQIVADNSKHSFHWLIVFPYASIFIIIPCIFKFGYAYVYFPFLVSFSSTLTNEQILETNVNIDPPTYASLEAGLPLYDDVNK